MVAPDCALRHSGVNGEPPYTSCGLEVASRAAAVLSPTAGKLTGAAGPRDEMSATDPK
jgi:hypothetical protein